MKDTAGRLRGVDRQDSFGGPVRWHRASPVAALSTPGSGGVARAPRTREEGKGATQTCARQEES